MVQHRSVGNGLNAIECLGFGILGPCNLQLNQCCTFFMIFASFCGASEDIPFFVMPAAYLFCGVLEGVPLL